MHVNAFMHHWANLPVVQNICWYLPSIVLFFMWLNLVTENRMENGEQWLVCWLMCNTSQKSVIAFYTLYVLGFEWLGIRI